MTDPDVMLDFVDQCEEMAAAYGCLPQQIMEMPWVHLKVWMASFNKRQRREYKMQAALRNLEMAQNLGMLTGGNTGSVPAAAGRPDINLDDDRAFDYLKRQGFPVEVR